MHFHLHGSVKHHVRHTDRDMTEGSIVSHLLLFALPLLIGNVFQQLYNAVDSIFIGNLVGKEALAAMGGTGPITAMFVFFAGGLATGAGVVISGHYGARNEKALREAVQTTYSFMLVLSLVMTVLGLLITPLMLRLMNTPEDVVGEASVYLNIYFWGISGLLLYNAGAGILRAVGDSRRPLIILVISTLMNIVLDYVFIKHFAWGIAGAAYATIISQFVSALLVFTILAREKAGYRVEPFRLQICLPELRRIVRIGLPSALQMALTSFSNVFVLSYINAFGSSYMAGWSAYIKIDNFAVQPVISLSMAITTFVGQNMGAGKTGRVNKIPLYGFIIAEAILITTITPLIIFAPQLVSLFGSDPELIERGTYFIRIISPCYVAFGVNQVYRGLLSGKGDTKVIMVIMLSTFVAFRQIYLFTVSRMGLGLFAVSMGYPVGWFLCAALFLIYYHTVGKNKNRLKL